MSVVINRNTANIEPKMKSQQKKIAQVSTNKQNRFYKQNISQFLNSFSAFSYFLFSAVF